MPKVEKGPIELVSLSADWLIKGGAMLSLSAVMYRSYQIQEIWIYSYPMLTAVVITFAFGFSMISGSAVIISGALLGKAWLESRSGWKENAMTMAFSIIMVLAIMGMVDTLINRE